MAQPQHARQLRERALVAAAIEVEPLAGLRGASAGAVHKLGAGDAVIDTVTEHQRPHERLAVRDRDVGGADRLAESRILLGRRHGVRVGDAHVATMPGGDDGVDPIQRAVVVDQRQRHAEHLRSVGAEGRRRYAPCASMVSVRFTSRFKRVRRRKRAPFGPRVYEATSSRSAAMSCSTIRAIMSAKGVCGSHPSSRLAFDESPTTGAGSAGRANAGSTLT
jgi:hypothetical protein